MNNYLKHLIEDPKVYYIYQRGSSIYGLNTKDSDIDFLVVIDSNYVLPEEFQQYEVDTGYFNVRKNIQIDNCDFIFLLIQDWFNEILNNTIPAWECTCLNKKFIKKEYVKLIMQTDIIVLIKNLLKQLSIIDTFNNKAIWIFIKNVIFTQQIIDYHKIVDFKEANKYYSSIISSDIENSKKIAKKIWIDFYNKNKFQYECYIKSNKIKN